MQKHKRTIVKDKEEIKQKLKLLEDEAEALDRKHILEMEEISSEAFRLNQLFKNQK